MSSSTQQLWAPQPQRPQPSAAEKLNTVQGNLVPGTWLSLSPTSSPRVTSPAASPALTAETAVSMELRDDFILRPASEKFLSNSITSRSSSMSSDASAPVIRRHPPLAPRFHVAPDVERREMAVGRAGGLAAVFGGN